jgi:hypothetical protein
MNGVSSALAISVSIPTAKHALLFLLLGLIGGFVGARVCARLARATQGRRFRSLRRGDLHIYHVVYGIVIMLVSGTLAFALGAGNDWRSTLAFCFGGGVGIALDEFALILHLDDVYWTEAGRRSVDAAIVTTAATLMLLLGVMPVGADTDRPQLGWLAAAIVTVNLVAVAVAALKGKRMLAVMGVFVPLLAPLGALTLARPDSPWARRMYRGGSAKTKRAERRALLLQSYRHRLLDLVAGAPGTERRS